MSFTVTLEGEIRFRIAAAVDAAAKCKTSRKRLGGSNVFCIDAPDSSTALDIWENAEDIGEVLKQLGVAQKIAIYVEGNCVHPPFKPTSLN
jgi:hypothetical protein